MLFTKPRAGALAACAALFTALGRDSREALSSGPLASQQRDCARATAGDVLDDAWAIVQTAAHVTAPPPTPAGDQPPGALRLSRLSLRGGLGPLERFLVAGFAVVGASPARHAPGVSWLQSATSLAQGTADSTVIVTMTILVLAVVFFALVIFFVHSRRSPRTHQKLGGEVEEEDAAAGYDSGPSSERSERHSLSRMQSLLPVWRQQSLPAAVRGSRSRGPFAAPPQELLGSDRMLPVPHAEMSAQDMASEASSVGNEMSRMASVLSGDNPLYTPPALNSSPLPRHPRDASTALKPASSSPPGQGVPGGRFTVPRRPSTSVSAELPPPLCSSLVLPVCEAHFAVALPALTAVDEGGGGSLDIVGLTGNPLLRATVQDMPAGRLLEVSMTHPGSAPRATVGPPAGAGGSPVAPAMVAPSERVPMEIRGADGDLYGLLQAKSASQYTVVRTGREVLAIQGAGDSLELSVTAGEQPVAEAICNEGNFGGAMHLEIRVQPGLDPVLIISCLLAIVLQST
mmetsp:Transcript_18088/g.56659  ORF Transcript_18088/g.56659 Transcript_18088/m.56659 type:complete len:515 (+) Transcript_18088:65-1609(+)